MPGGSVLTDFKPLTILEKSEKQSGGLVSPGFGVHGQEIFYASRPKLWIEIRVIERSGVLF